MIETPTVLILGAGASAPYGYPIGSELKSRIISSLKGMLEADNGWVHDLKFDTNLVAEFNAKFATSPLSIDEFLSYQKEEFVPIGKTAIVDIISKSETKEQLLNSNDDNWYENFAKNLISPFKDIGSNVGIISYNYDRSLEAYLYYALISSFPECDNLAECRNIIGDNIDIVHMYGRLDPLPWECRGAIRDYGGKCSSNSLKDLSSRINLIQEAEKKGKVDKANELIEKANRVYFLGMDLYSNRANVELLDTSLLQKKNILITGFKLEQGERKNIENYFNMIQKGNPRFNVTKRTTLQSIRQFRPF